MLISLEEIKQHLRIDNDDSTELDAELTAFYAAAVEYAEDYTSTEIGSEMRATMRQAILLMIGDFYENREALGASRKEMHEHNTTVDRLLWFNRVSLGV